MAKRSILYSFLFLFICGCASDRRQKAEPLSAQTSAKGQILRAPAAELQKGECAQLVSAALESSDLRNLTGPSWVIAQLGFNRAKELKDLRIEQLEKLVPTFLYRLSSDPGERAHDLKLLAADRNFDERVNFSEAAEYLVVFGGNPSGNQRVLASRFKSVNPEDPRLSVFRNIETIIKAVQVQFKANCSPNGSLPDTGTFLLDFVRKISYSKSADRRNVDLAISALRTFVWAQAANKGKMRDNFLNNFLESVSQSPMYSDIIKRPEFQEILYHLLRLTNFVEAPSPLKLLYAWDGPEPYDKRITDVVKLPDILLIKKVLGDAFKFHSSASGEASPIATASLKIYNIFLDQYRKQGQDADLAAKLMVGPFKELEISEIEFIKQYEDQPQ